jgi:hypothetical protein
MGGSCWWEGVNSRFGVNLREARVSAQWHQFPSAPTGLGLVDCPQVEPPDACHLQSPCWRPLTAATHRIRKFRLCPKSRFSMPAWSDTRKRVVPGVWPVADRWAFFPKPGPGRRTLPQERYHAEWVRERGLAPRNFRGIARGGRVCWSTSRARSFGMPRGVRGARYSGADS